MDFFEVLPSIIGGVTSIIVAVLALVIGRFNSKNDKETSVLEQQYTKVISPIHYILRVENKTNITNNIERIVKENYYLLPNNFWNEYQTFLTQINFIDENMSNIEQLDFYKKVDKYFRVLRYELKYSNTKRPKNKKTSDIHLPVNENRRTRSVILTVLTVFLIVYYTASILDLIFNQPDVSANLKLPRIIVLSQMLIITIVAFFIKK